MIGKNSAVQVRSATWVGEIQLGGKTGGVMGMRSATWVCEMHFSGRTSGGMEMRSAVPNSRSK